MKTVTHSIQAWPKEAISDFKLFAVLQRTLIDPSFSLDHLEKIGAGKYCLFPSRQDLMLSLLNELIESNLPMKVETSEDLKEFKTTFLPFSSLHDFLCEQKSLSLTYYPAHYPTKEVFNAEVESIFIKLYGV